ncbi:hypothetical protein Trydic_g22571 [Trypoxylus dichotomus]
MSTIDLHSGFWQVPIPEQDRDKTCFTLPFGIYKFLRMPFGLRNSPATFVRLIDRFRAGLKECKVFTYIDDILLLSETFEQHLSDLGKVFDRFRLFSLRARRSKCHFCRSSVQYLGHINIDGIGINPGKISAITSVEPPICTKVVHRFVETCSWYRKFVPNFLDIARPLTNLLMKGKPFQFGEKELQAFNTLREKLTSPPILTQADQTKPYVLRTDASGFALGAVLLQGDCHDEKPVKYATRLLTSAETNYSTIDREVFAVVWVVEKFRTYIEGAEVTIAGNHQPLLWLFSLKTPS